MPGLIPRSLSQVLYDIASQGQETNPDQPGQVVTDVLAAVGGLTTAGSALLPNAAAGVTWLAVGTGTQAFSVGLTAIATEIARVPVVALSLSGVSGIVTGLIGPGIGWGWLQEVGVFGGAATGTPGSGDLLGYVALSLPYLKTGAKLVAVQWSAQ